MGLLRRYGEKPYQQRYMINPVIVADAAATAVSEDDFLARIRDAGASVRTRNSTDRPGQATGYAVSLPADQAGMRQPAWFGGGKLAPDLTLPKLRCRWERPGYGGTAHLPRRPPPDQSRKRAPHRLTVAGYPPRDQRTGHPDRHPDREPPRPRGRDRPAPAGSGPCTSGGGRQNSRPSARRPAPGPVASTRTRPHPAPRTPKLRFKQPETGTRIEADRLLTDEYRHREHLRALPGDPTKPVSRR